MTGIFDVGVGPKRGCAMLEEIKLLMASGAEIPVTCEVGDLLRELAEWHLRRNTKQSVDVGLISKQGGLP